MNEPFDISSWSKVDPRAVKLWRIQNVIAVVIWSIIIGIGEFVLFGVGDVRSPFPLGVITGLFFIAYLALRQWLISRAYECYRYKLNEHDLAVAKGIFWKNWRFVNRNRVQHVDITAGPIARSLGLVEVAIYVGGQSTAAAQIDGLSNINAEILRSRLVASETKASSEDSSSGFVTPTSGSAPAPVETSEPPAPPVADVPPPDPGDLQR